MSQPFELLKVKIEQRPCHICGSKEFEWGYIDSMYQPRLLTTKFSRKRSLVSSRKCSRCGNLQMFTDAESTQKVRSWSTVILIVIMLIACSPLIAGAIRLIGEFLRMQR